MEGVLLGKSEWHWGCPNCTSQLVTAFLPDKPLLHPCRGLKGLLAPMIEDGINAKVEAVEREDYLNGDEPQTDGEGKPIMAIVTTRDEGQDCAVLPPTARLRVS